MFGCVPRLQIPWKSLQSRIPSWLRHQEPFPFYDLDFLPSSRVLTSCFLIPFGFLDTAILISWLITSCFCRGCLISSLVTSVFVPASLWFHAHNVLERIETSPSAPLRDRLFWKINLTSYWPYHPSAGPGHVASLIPRHPCPRKLPILSCVSWCSLSFQHGALGPAAQLKNLAFFGEVGLFSPLERLTPCLIVPMIQSSIPFEVLVCLVEYTCFKLMTKLCFFWVFHYFF